MKVQFPGAARLGARRLSMTMLAVGLVAGGLVSLRSAAVPERADAQEVAPRPGATAALDLNSLDPTPLKQWGVVGTGLSYSVAKPQVWDFAEIGDTLYVGGTFTGVRRDGDDASSTVQSQAYLAAFDRDSGEWISTFRPTFNRTIYSLEVSPGGKLLVGGEFTTVNGQARAGIVMLDPVTGATVPSFVAYTEGNNNMVREIVRSGNDIYIAGQFYYVRGGAAVPWMWNAARLNGDTGALDIGWIPKFAGGLWDIAIDNDNQRVYAAGYFTSTNSQPGTARMSAVTMATGAYIPGLTAFTNNEPNQTDTTSVVYTDGRVYVGGAQHVIQVLRASDLTRIGYNTTGVTCTAFNPANCNTFYGGGDTQTMEVTANGIVLAGCHCFGPGQYANTTKPLHYNSFANTFTDLRFAFGYDGATSLVASTFRPGLKGKQWGTYAIDVDSRGCYYVGGDYERTAAGAWLGGFARFCKQVAPPTGLTATSALGAANLSWTAASTQLPVKYYKIYRSGIFVADTTSLQYTVSGLTAGSRQGFTVRAMDASGRLSPEASVSVTIVGSPADDTLAPTVPANVAGAPSGTSVTLTWSASTDLPDPGGSGVSGYLVHRDWNFVKFVPAGTLTWTDTGVPAGDRRYEVRAVDVRNNISAPTVVTVAVGDPDTLAPTVPASPTAVMNDTSVVVGWGASTDLPDPGGIGLSGYLIHRDYQFVTFVPAGTLLFSDPAVASGAHRYEVRSVDKRNNISTSAVVNITVP